MRLEQPDDDEIAKLTELNLPEHVLKALKYLENPTVYGVTKEGLLIVGDGNIPAYTRGMSYVEALADVQGKGLSLLRFPFRAVMEKLHNGCARNLLTWTKRHNEEGGAPPIYVGYDSKGLYTERNKESDKIGCANIGTLRMCYINISRC